MSIRIVSLLPSATEIVCALGLRSFLAGRSHECDFPPGVRELPACTRTRVDASGTSAQIHAGVTAVLQNHLSVYEVDEALLRELRPTHIVTQIQCEVCAVNTNEVTHALRDWSEAPQVISLGAMTLSGVFQDFLRVARPFGREAAARSLIRGFEELAAFIGARLPERRERVVGIEWLEPLMGTGNWMPELMAAAGGVDLLATSGHHAAWLAWDALRGSGAATWLVFPCGFTIGQSERDLEQIPEWRDSSTTRIVIADGNQFFNRPGPRLRETLEVIAEALHPDRFDFGHRGTSWREWRPRGSAMTAREVVG